MQKYDIFHKADFCFYFFTDSTLLVHKMEQNQLGQGLQFQKRTQALYLHLSEFARSLVTAQLHIGRMYFPGRLSRIPPEGVK